MIETNPSSLSTDQGESSQNENSSPIVDKQILRRVNALKNIQVKMVDYETKFYDELHQLECKYRKLYEPLTEQRAKIINGEYEPADEECKWTYGDEGEQDELDDIADKMDTKMSLSEEEALKGIPLFWLQVFKRTELISDMIQEHDEKVLAYLKDIKLYMHDKKPYGYTIEFHFNRNEFFTNAVLTKTYELTCDKDERDPLSYDGPVMYKSIGCKIDWNEGQDVTYKLVKKKQKHKNSGTIRVVTKKEKQDSFFNYFETPTVDGFRPSFRKEAPIEDDDEISNEERLIEADFEIGHFIKEFIVPNATLYYTGDMVDEASFDEGDEDEEEEDEEHELNHGDTENSGICEDETEEENYDKPAKPISNKIK